MPFCITNTEKMTLGECDMIKYRFPVPRFNGMLNLMVKAK